MVEPEGGWVEGTAFLVARFQPSGTADISGADVVMTYDGPRRIDVGLGSVVQLLIIEDFEANLWWAIGLTGEKPFRVGHHDRPAPHLRRHRRLTGGAAGPIPSLRPHGGDDLAATGVRSPAAGHGVEPGVTPEAVVAGPAEDPVVPVTGVGRVPARPPSSTSSPCRTSRSSGPAEPSRRLDPAVPPDA